MPTTFHIMASHRCYCLLDSRQVCVLQLPAICDIQLVYMQCRYVAEMPVIWESHKFWEDGKPCDLGLSQEYWKWRRDSRKQHHVKICFVVVTWQRGPVLRIALESSKGLLKSTYQWGTQKKKRSRRNRSLWRRYRATAEQQIKRSWCNYSETNVPVYPNPEGRRGYNCLSINFIPYALISTKSSSFHEMCIDGARMASWWMLAWFAGPGWNLHATFYNGWITEFSVINFWEYFRCYIALDSIRWEAEHSKSRPQCIFNFLIGLWRGNPIYCHGCCFITIHAGWGIPATMPKSSWQLGTKDRSGSVLSYHLCQQEALYSHQ